VLGGNQPKSRRRRDLGKPNEEDISMEKSQFGITWRWTDYCYAEISEFLELSDNIPNDEGLRDRYNDFLRTFLDKKIKKNTEVPLDLLKLFIDDIGNRAQIDYVENHWEDDKNVTAGGKRFFNRYQQLRAIHQITKRYYE
jgi:hypothetical protein